MDLWYFVAKSTNGGLDSTLYQYASALRRLSELKSRRAMEEHKKTILSELVTLFSVQLANPSTNTSFLLLRQEASKAALVLQKTVLLP